MLEFYGFFIRNVAMLQFYGFLLELDEVDFLLM